MWFRFRRGILRKASRNNNVSTALIELFNEMWKHQKMKSQSYIVPTAFRNSLPASSFEMNQENDAHQLFAFILNKLLENTGNNDFVKRIFYGVTYTERKCSSYGCESAKHKLQETDLAGLTITVPNNGKSGELTAQHLVTEHLKEGESPAKCMACDCNLNEAQKVSIWPNILVIQFSLFTYNTAVLNSSTKIMKFITPDEFINVETDEGVKVEYQLKGAIIHVGSEMTTGHYYSVVNENGNIMTLNDTLIEENCTRDAFKGIQSYNETPYVLIYERTHQQQQHQQQQQEQRQSQPDEQMEVDPDPDDDDYVDDDDSLVLSLGSITLGQSKDCYLDISTVRRCVISSVEITTDGTILRGQLVDKLSMIPSPKPLVCLMRGAWKQVRITSKCVVSVLGAWDAHFHFYCITNEVGYVVVMPDILITASTMSTNFYCTRQAILNQLFKDTEHVSNMLVNSFLNLY